MNNYHININFILDFTLESSNYFVLNYGYNTHNLFSYKVDLINIYNVDYINFNNITHILNNEIFLYNLVSLLFHNLSITSISFLFKCLILLWPLVFFFIISIVILHILYALEFLLNDYIECVLFRRMCSILLSWSMLCWIFSSVLILYLNDIYGIYLYSYNVEILDINYNINIPLSICNLYLDEEYLQFYENINIGSLFGQMFSMYYGMNIFELLYGYI